MILARRPGVGRAGARVAAAAGRLGPDDPKLQRVRRGLARSGRLDGRVDGRPHERAQAALVVADVDLPHPRRAAAVAAAGDRVDRARP